MLPSTTLIVLSSLLILLLHSHPLSASNRRILHHPLLLSPLPPSEPPFPSPIHHRMTSVITSAPQPTLSTPDDDTNLPFFPTYSPPPPQPPPPPPPVLTSIPTFPANVSSLALPTTSSPSHSHSNKLIILTAAAVVALVSLIVFVFIIRRKSGRSSSELRPLYPHDTPTSDGCPPPFPPQPQSQLKLPNASQTSSEFLYLGTVSAETSEFQVMPTVPTTSSFPEVVDERVYHLKLCGSGSSPELKPLPPLPRSSEFFRLAGEQGGVSETTTRAEKFFHNNNVEEFFSPSNSSRHDDDDYFNNSGLKSCFSSSCHGSPSNNSPGRDSDDVSVEIQALAEKAEFVPAPPPLPPQGSRLSVGPPTLVPPSGPVVMKRSGNLSKSGERFEENGGIKPKLKALYWDKVRASSDRVTVWDQLHPGSFK